MAKMINYKDFVLISSEYLKNIRIKKKVRNLHVFRGISTLSLSGKI